MNTPDFPTPGDYHDPELAPLADTLRPVVDKGHARRLALEIVRLCLVAFAPLAAGPLFPMSDWFGYALAVLNLWHARALDIDSGREATLPPSSRLTLLDVAGAADRIASMANQKRKPGAWHGEAAIVYDLATALQRACGCSDCRPLRATDLEDVEHLRAKARKNPSFGEYDKLANAYQRANDAHRAHHDHTARTLLPLLVRDVREMLRDARVDGAEIEAAIVAHGGTPS